MKYYLKRISFACALFVMYASMLPKNAAAEVFGEENTRPELSNSTFLGFGIGRSALLEGAADISIAKTGGTDHGNIDYLSKFSFLGLMEAGYVVSERLFLEVAVGMNKYATVNEKTLNGAFFGLTTFSANAQAKLALARGSDYRPYVGVGASLDYEKIDFSPMATDVGKLKVGGTSGAEINKLKGIVDDAHLSLTGSMGIIVIGDDNFMFDIGYLGKYSITSAQFTLGKNFTYLSPVSHSLITKVRMYA